MSKFLVMRVIAKASFVSAKSLSQELGMNSQQLSELVTEMIGRSEVECSTYSSGETMLVMTPRGVAEYMRILESIYEIPE